MRAAKPRLTATQRADRDFWLSAAENAYRMAAGEWMPQGFLCLEVQHRTTGEDAVERRCAQLALFTNDLCRAWWLTKFDVTVVHPSDKHCGPAEGRVLAACFLAAMCETGDV